MTVGQDATIVGNMTVQGDAEVTGELTFNGDITPQGLVNGRDIEADGEKLDTISEAAKNVAVLTGTIVDGQIIPLPAGFNQSQCRWLVSPQVFDPPTFDINEGGVNARFRIECFAHPDRSVVVRWWQLGHGATSGFRSHAGVASYIIVGVQ